VQSYHISIKNKQVTRRQIPGEETKKKRKKKKKLDSKTQDQKTPAARVRNKWSKKEKKNEGFKDRESYIKTSEL